MSRKILLPLLLCCGMVLVKQTVFAQSENLKIIARYDSLNNAMPREKLYVHFDKHIYTQLDTIWFKAYLFDETLKSAAQQSALIYVELIDAKGNIVKTVSLPTGSGITWGGLALNTKLFDPGIYTFRAYTNWMRNFGDRYFFKKEIKIIGLDSEQIIVTADLTPSGSNFGKRTASNSAKASAIDFQFLPEGGNWVANRAQFLAFKALSSNGKGILLQGDIVDSKQQKITSFSTNKLGMGFVTMTPKYGETYTAIVTNLVGIKNTTLPKVLENGITLQVKNAFSSDSLTVTVTSDVADQELSVIGQSRGLITFVAKVKANVKTKTFNFSKNIFPSGISQVTILNAAGQPINERSFFINHNDQLQLTVHTGDHTFSTRDSIPFQLKAINAAGNPIVGSFSIAVTDDAQVLKDTVNNANILSYLLLTSDLKGEIENPGSYFHQFNAQQHNELEALVLTQGWTSYLMHPNKTITFKEEKDFTISGKVTNLLNKPIAKANISLIGRNRGKLIAMQAIANDKGIFVFDKFPPIDSASLIIQALNTKDRRGTLGIVLNEFTPPTVTLTSKNAVDIIAVKTDSVSANLIKNQKSIYHGEGVALKEVNIKGKRIVKNSKNLNGPGEADLIITTEQLDRQAKKTLYDFLIDNIPGFYIGYIKHSSDKAYNIKTSPVKFIIDGVDLDYFYSPMGGPGSRDEHYRFIKTYLDYYNAEDIAGMEVMHSLGHISNYDAMYGEAYQVYKDRLNLGDTRAYIEITTKTGSGPFLKKSANIYLYKPHSYGDLKVFYSPKYNSTTKANKTPDLRSTIYWAPNLMTNTNGEAKTSFFSADKKGTYTIWIEGTDMAGHIGMKTMTLKIN